MRIVDTITAIATSSSNGGISVIRVSGEDSVAIVDRLFQSRNKEKKLANQKSHTIHYGFIFEGDQPVDEVIVLLMLAPNSYTRENVVEIDCHGGAVVSKKILELLSKEGARIAEPGEFTKRAFLNGRIDLSQAEAVIDIINAKNEYALKNSISQLKGTVKVAIEDLRKSILNNIAFIEAALDDPEHISIEGFSEDLLVQCEGYYKKLCHLRDNYDNGRIIKEGVRTVIVGKPNVGKSSLMNRLLRQDRAIVTQIPGTTRDLLEEDVQIGEISLKIIDTAGIHETEDIVEKIGITKTKESIEAADFVIAVVDSSEQIQDDDINIFTKIKDKPGVILLNKSDLEPVIHQDQLKTVSDKKVIYFSAKSGEGLSELENYLKELFYQDKLSFNDEIYISSARQMEALLHSIDSISKVLESIEMNMSEDFLSIDLVDAYEYLGRIIGETMEDDIVDTIFREFCMGK